MSDIFIRYLLSFVVLFCCETARVAGSAGQVARAKSDFHWPTPGRDVFYCVPIIAGEVRDAVERVLTG